MMGNTGVRDYLDRLVQIPVQQGDISLHLE